MKNSFEIYLYDWDGCIAKTLHLWLNAYQKFLNQRNTYIDDVEVVKKFFGNWNGPKEFGLSDSEEYMKEVLAEVGASLDLVDLYEDIEKVLRILKDKDKKIVIVSSAQRNQIEKIVHKKNLEKYFDLIISKDDVVKTKPNPESVIKALKTFSIDKDKAIIIGDSPHDVLAGKNANISTAIFYPIQNKVFYDKKTIKDANADYVLESHLDILKYV